MEEKTQAAGRKPAALYVCLSKEEKGRNLKDNILGQFELARAYVEKHPELVLTETFVDEVPNTLAEGTEKQPKFPEFTRMMEYVKRGKIQCIVVKDLARFGRNDLERGYYIETIFPLLQVRLVALENEFDTDRESDRDFFLSSVRNKTDTFRAETASQKQSGVRERKRRQGIYTVPIPPFGYEYSGEQGKLIPIKELAPYVRMVFSWTLAGIKRSEIAKRMELMGVPTPLQFLNDRGILSGRKGGGWTAHTIKGILSNPVYAGTVVMGKTGRRRRAETKAGNPEDVVCLYDMHQPIVSKGDYKKIEKLIEENRREKLLRVQENEQKRQGLCDCFKGMVYCGECGRPMVFARGSHKRDRSEYSFMYYRCTFGKKNAKCRNQRVQQNLLKIAVMDEIQKYIQKMRDRKELLEKKDILMRPKQETGLKNQKKESLEKKKASLYQEYEKGLLDREEYQLLKEETILEIQRAEEEIHRLRQKILEMEKESDHCRRQAERLEPFLHKQEFQEELVRELVSEIRVFNGNRIEVIFSDEMIKKDGTLME